MEPLNDRLREVATYLRRGFPHERSPQQIDTICLPPVSLTAKTAVVTAAQMQPGIPLLPVARELFMRKNERLD